MALIGETETRIYDIVNIRTPYPDVKGGTERIQVPNGYAILSYRADLRSRGGRIGYSFSLQGDASFGVSQSNISDTFKEISDYAKESGKEEKYKERLEYLREHASDIYSHAVTSHSTLIANWHCKHDGSFIDKKGGWLDLGVVIEIIRSFAPVDLQSLLVAFKAAISNDTPPENLSISMI